MGLIRFLDENSWLNLAFIKQRLLFLELIYFFLWLIKFRSAVSEHQGLGPTCQFLIR